MFVRFLVASVVGYFYLLLSGQLTYREIPNLLQSVFFPSVLLWVANFANSLALQYAGITIAYVVKACIPVVTCLILFHNGQRFSLQVYVSTLPICIGVAVASLSNIDFSTFGFLAAIVSTVAQASMSMRVKKFQESRGLPALKVFFGMSTVCTFFSLPMLFTAANGAPSLGDILFDPETTDARSW